MLVSWLFAALPSWAATNSAGADIYAGLFAKATLEAQERRPYLPETGEPCFAAFRELQPTERLERRTGMFRLQKDGPRARLDRIYRLREGDTAAASAETPSSLKPLDEGGGELVWSVAMFADHVLVKLRPGATLAELAALTSYRLEQQSGGSGLVARLATSARHDFSLEPIIAGLRALPPVLYAEPEFLVVPFQAGGSSADPILDRQWHLRQIHQTAAWHGSSDPAILAKSVVAIVDTGFDRLHPDLASNVWENPGDKWPDNGRDDDGNGRTDDHWGWDFYPFLTNNNPVDQNGHGTHVAGVVGAVGDNGLGGMGVAGSVRMMSIRTFKDSETFVGTSTAENAYRYIQKLNETTRQVAVANLSWGFTGFSQGLYDAINKSVKGSNTLYPHIGSTTPGSNIFTLKTASEATSIKPGMTMSGANFPDNNLVMLSNSANGQVTLLYPSVGQNTNVSCNFARATIPSLYGTVSVAAAGNSNLDLDKTPIFPACYPIPFIIAVGGSGAADEPIAGAFPTNYGKLSVHVFAPGDVIWSTWWKDALAPDPGDGYLPINPTEGYWKMGGTSYAAAQVSGAVALLRMKHPECTELQIKAAVIANADYSATLAGKCVSNGRLDVKRLTDLVSCP